MTRGIDGFNKLMQGLPELLQRLEESEAFEVPNRKAVPKSGVYVFYENNKPIYVGRSNNMKERLLQHGRRSSGHNQASFAFILAKEAMKVDGKGLRKEQITRKELEGAPGFKQAFSRQKLRVRQMTIRLIGINDQTTQALFEIYASLALNTHYNDFSTH